MLIGVIVYDNLIHNITDPVRRKKKLIINYNGILNCCKGFLIYNRKVVDCVSN